MLNNNELVNLLEEHLKNGNNHILKVESNNIKLSKKKKKRKYAFNLLDIREQYGNINNFLKYLSDKGFLNPTFTLQKMYGSEEKTTYHTLKKITQNLKNMSNTTTLESNFLGMPQMLNKIIQAERASEYKEELSELKEDIKELKAKNRILKEENNSLNIKIETIKEHAELKLQKELLNKKSFFESSAFDRTMGALGEILPKILENTATAKPKTQLNALKPSIKNNFIKKIISENITDNQIMYLNYLLTNWNEEILKKINQIIDENEQ